MKNTQERIRDSFQSQGLMTMLGARIVLVADGEVQIELPFSEKLVQQHGYLHGGAITSIVDSACGYAALTKASAADEVVSAEFKVNFMRPAIGDRFIAIGKVLHSGKLLAVCIGEVRAYSGADYKVIAVMQATIVYVPV